jgi:hypothetical protein
MVSRCSFEVRLPLENDLPTETPEPDERRFIVAHDDAGIRSTNEVMTAEIA